MSQYALERILRPITNKLTLMLGRAVIRAVAIDKGQIALDAEMFADDIVAKMEYFTHHGLFSKPPSNSHCIMLCPGGRRENAVIVAVKSAASIPAQASAAEIALYTSQGSVIALMENGDIHVKASKVNVNCATAEITAAEKLSMQAPMIDLKAAAVKCTGVFTTASLQFAAAAEGDAPPTVTGKVNFDINGTMVGNAVRTRAGKDLDNHTHPYTDNGSALVTGVPR